MLVFLMRLASRMPREKLYEVRLSMIVVSSSWGGYLKDGPSNGCAWWGNVI